MASSGPQLTASLMCSVCTMLDKVMMNSSSLGTLQREESRSGTAHVT